MTQKIIYFSKSRYVSVITYISFNIMIHSMEYGIERKVIKIASKLFLLNIEHHRKISKQFSTALVKARHHPYRYI